MSKTVYIDTNTWVDLHALRNGVTEHDRHLLSKLVKSRSIDIPISLLVFEERSYSSHERLNVNPFFDFVLRYVNDQRILDGPQGILIDTLESFLYDTSTPGPFIEGLMRDAILAELRNPHAVTSFISERKYLDQTIERRIGWWISPRFLQEIHGKWSRPLYTLHWSCRNLYQQGKSQASLERMARLRSQYHEAVRDSWWQDTLRNVEC